MHWNVRLKRNETKTIWTAISIFYFRSHKVVFMLYVSYIGIYHINIPSTYYVNVIWSALFALAQQINVAYLYLLEIDSLAKVCYITVSIFDHYATSISIAIANSLCVSEHWCQLWHTKCVVQSEAKQSQNNTNWNQAKNDGKKAKKNIDSNSVNMRY